MLLGQQAACVPPGLVDRLTAEYRVRPGEVDVLKDAHVAGGSRAVLPDGAYPVPAGHYDLTRLQIPLEGGPHGGEGAGLGGEDHRLAPAAHAQRPEVPGVPGGDELLGRHDDEGEGTAQTLQSLAHRLLSGGTAEPFLGDGVGDELGVGGGLEDGAPVLKGGAQLVGVDQVAVVGYGQGALDVLEGQGLGVLPAAAAGGGVAHVAHGHGAPQLVQNFRGEHLSHKAQVLVKGHLTVLNGGDAAGLLSPVLEGKETIIDGAGAVTGGVQHAEDTTFLMD